MVALNNNVEKNIKKTDCLANKAAEEIFQVCLLENGKEFRKIVNKEGLYND